MSRPQRCPPLPGCRRRLSGPFVELPSVGTDLAAPPPISSQRPPNSTARTTGHPGRRTISRTRGTTRSLRIGPSRDTEMSAPSRFASGTGTRESRISRGHVANRMPHRQSNMENLGYGGDSASYASDLSPIRMSLSTYWRPSPLNSGMSLSTTHPPSPFTHADPIRAAAGSPSHLTPCWSASIGRMSFALFLLSSYAEKYFLPRSWTLFLMESICRQ